MYICWVQIPSYSLWHYTVATEHFKGTEQKEKETVCVRVFGNHTLYCV